MEALGYLNRTVLKLNSDYNPIGTISVREALCLIFREVVYAIEHYAEQIKDSAGRLYELPKIVVLKEFSRHLMGNAQFSKKNVLIRDNHECCYCGDKLKRSEATLDHVVPKSKGGKTVWNNIVTACEPCNTYKGNRLVKECSLSLLRNPYVPTKLEILNKQFKIEW